MINHTVKSLLARIDILDRNMREGGSVKGIAIDHREVKEDFLFVAIQGAKADGYNFIRQAINFGASVIISERVEDKSVTRGKVIWVQVTDSRIASSQAAEWFYGDPSRHLKLVGVTGTNGKSSIVYMLHQLMESLGYRAGMFSTIVNKNHLEEMPSRLTTPDPISLSRDLDLMLRNRCDYVFMEVSSHALEQRRVYGLDFDVAVFTNITQDHLDYHGTFKNYLHAKKLFFDQLKTGAFAVINADDRNGMYMVQNTAATVKTYGLRSLADYKSRILEMDMQSMNIRIEGQELLTRVSGRFNAYNLLAVFAVADLCGLYREEILPALSLLRGVPGRFQRTIIDNEGPVGIVDYAHTPDAVEKVTQAASDILRGDGRILIALGCGGDRDRGKRPAMAKAAAQNADIVILTSDNPRNEDPLEIIEEMYGNLPPPLKAKVFKIADRREAIRMAVSMSYKSDVIIIAGKGHEQYQEIKGKKYPFDDQTELEEALSLKKKS